MHLFFNLNVSSLLEKKNSFFRVIYYLLKNDVGYIF